MSQPANMPLYTVPPLFKTVKLLVLMAVPLAVVTLTNPEPAFVGTTAVIRVPESMLNAALVPLKATADAPPKFVPVMITLEFTGPLVGVKPKMAGGGFVCPSTFARNAIATPSGSAVKKVSPVSTWI
jgi:hypothetical protein